MPYWGVKFAVSNSRNFDKSPLAAVTSNHSQNNNPIRYICTRTQFKKESTINNVTEWLEVNCARARPRVVLRDVRVSWMKKATWTVKKPERTKKAKYKIFAKRHFSNTHAVCTAVLKDDIHSTCAERSSFK